MAAKKWTVLVWIAGDNDLQSHGEQDIAEMKRVGSTADLDVVVQFDRMDDRSTRRYRLRRGTPLEADLLKDLGETNCGDPKVAADFLAWGIESFPAERYLAVLWNHGSGIDETDVYRRARERGVSIERHAPRGRGALPRSRARAATHSRYRRALFASTLEAAWSSRAIAYDDTNRDFLDDLELKRVLAGAHRATGRRIDVLGCDACLMNMVEIAHQVRGHAGVLVGSEEVEPLDGWPYQAILADLAAQPAMGAHELGRTVVRRYLQSYSADAVTQSALDLARCDDVAAAVDRLAGALLAAVERPAGFEAVHRALRSAQRYDLPDFLDLHDLCDELVRRVPSKAVKDAAGGVVAALSQGAAPFVIAEGHKGREVARSHGVSIYFPAGRVNVSYGRLDFARATRWGELVRALG